MKTHHLFIVLGLALVGYFLWKKGLIRTPQMPATTDGGTQ